MVIDDKGSYPLARGLVGDCLALSLASLLAQPETVGRTRVVVAPHPGSSSANQFILHQNPCKVSIPIFEHRFALRSMEFRPEPSGYA